jgi:hypothetical protein
MAHVDDDDTPVLYCFCGASVPADAFPPPRDAARRYTCPQRGQTMAVMSAGRSGNA